MVRGSLNHATSWGVLLSEAITLPAFVTWLEGGDGPSPPCHPWNSGEHLVFRKAPLPTVLSCLLGLWVVWGMAAVD